MLAVGEVSMEAGGVPDRAGDGEGKGLAPETGLARPVEGEVSTGLLYVSGEAGAGGGGEACAGIPDVSGEAGEVCAGMPDVPTLAGLEAPCWES
jgi:hypothetical protein